MLTKQDFDHNLRILNGGCKVGIIPLHWNCEKKELELLESKWKRAICCIYFALFIIHTAFLMSRLPYLLLSGIHPSLVSLVVHFTLICATMAVVFWHFVAFFRFPGITATCYNKALEPWGIVHEGRVFTDLAYSSITSKLSKQLNMN